MGNMRVYLYLAMFMKTNVILPYSFVRGMGKGGSNRKQHATLIVEKISTNNT